jgi:riboflavin biosynthesis pyrimidine reductase
MKSSPLQTLIASSRGSAVPLPPQLARIYGEFRMRRPRTGFHVFSNFVSSLDGIVTLKVRGHSGGGDISGFSSQDRLVMGLLRAVADAVVVGAGALADDPQHIWTAQAICPELASEFRKLETDVGKRGPPLNVLVSASGEVDLRLPVFAAGLVQAAILTTRAGAMRLRKHKVPNSVRILALPSRSGEISAAAMLRAMGQLKGGGRILVEGGPQLLATFYKSRDLDEQFLSLAPQIAGRESGDGRLGLVMGETFAPRDPRWGKLVDARRGAQLLFLRYEFPRSHAR